MVNISMTWRRRVIKAERCCSSCVGNLVGCGLTASPKRTRSLASIRSVFASKPMDLANKRTRRGLTKATGSPTADNSTSTARSSPPVDSMTIKSGCNSCNWLVSFAMDSRSLCADHSHPGAQMSNRALETSIPMTTAGFSWFILPSLFCIMEVPGLAEFGLNKDHLTVRATNAKDPATHALRRSSKPNRESACRVPHLLSY